VTHSLVGKRVTKSYNKTVKINSTLMQLMQFLSVFGPFKVRVRASVIFVILLHKTSVWFST